MSPSRDLRKAVERAPLSTKKEIRCHHQTPERLQLLQETGKLLCTLGQVGGECCCVMRDQTVGSAVVVAIKRGKRACVADPGPKSCTVRLCAPGHKLNSHVCYRDSDVRFFEATANESLQGTVGCIVCRCFRRHSSWSGRNRVMCLVVVCLLSSVLMCPCFCAPRPASAHRLHVAAYADTCAPWLRRHEGWRFSPTAFLPRS
jgi:hypothetical protein